MAKEKTITLTNTGLAAIYINRKRILPDEEIDVQEDMLKNEGIIYLIGRGEIAVKGDHEKTKEIKSAAVKNKKKDRDEGKSKKELEDGGEYS